MKKKELNELKTKSVAELGKKLLDLEKEKIQAQLELKMGKVKNVHLALQKKRDISRIKTVIRLKSLASQTEEPKEQKEAKNAAG